MASSESQACSLGNTWSFLPSKESTNYMRLCHLIVTICTSVLRCILDRYVPPAELPGALSRNMWILTQTPLNKQQKAVLFPKGQPAKVISSKQFDISLLYILLRNITGIKEHSRGLGKTPEDGDISLSACIEKLRFSKNNLNSHTVTCEVSNEAFNDIWSELRSIVDIIERSELSGTSFVLNIDELLNADLDPDKSAEYSKELKRMKLEEHETKEMIQYMDSKKPFDCSRISLSIVCIYL